MKNGRFYKIENIFQGRGKLMHAVGISELVKGYKATFIDDPALEKIEVVDPSNVKLILDDSSQFRNSRLYLASMLRKIPIVSRKIEVGDKAVINKNEYQFYPANKSLKQPLPRILIADAVGLGKTIEAGVLASELIRRGKAERILFATVKSMLTQFQKEFWVRFTIPLVKLDSEGIQKIRTKIPSNMNPFHYIKRTIISIDTLKSDQYRYYLENCSWDLVIIDECHNMAVRKTRSQRSSAASLLADTTESLTEITQVKKKKSLQGLKLASF